MTTYWLKGLGENVIQGQSCSESGSRRAYVQAMLALLCGIGLSASVMACDTLDWNSDVDAGGNFNSSLNPSLESDCGLEVDVDGVNPAYVVDNSPGLLTSPPVTQYLARFYMAQDDLALGADDELILFGGYDNASSPVFQLVLVEDSGHRKIKLIAYDNSGNPVSSMDNEVILPYGWRAVQVEWKAASGPGSADGFFSLKLDGVAAVGMQNLTGLSNETFVLDTVRLGVVNGDSLLTSSGNVKFDAFVSYRDGDGGLIDKNCSGNKVLLEHITFLPGSKTCVATTSLSTGAVLTIDGGADVTMISPELRLQAGFSVPSGGTFRFIAP